MCKKYGVSKVTSVIMVVVMLLSTFISVNASVINSSQGNGKSKVVAEIAPAMFSATVPYVLPISVDADNNVSVADNAKIVNNSNGPINVVGAEISTNNDWELVDSSTNFKSVPVNTKQLKMKIMGSSLAPSGSVDTSLFDTISGQSSISLTYDAETAVQSEAIDGENVANALFTVEWDELFISKATVSKSALNTFAKSAVSFQKTQENLNIDDVKADSRMTKIDDGTTDYSIYAWKDSANNGYWWTNAITTYLPEDSSELFYDCSRLSSLDLNGFNTSKIINMDSMFGWCMNLSLLDLSNFDTSKVITMIATFEHCHNLISLNLSNIDTRNVKNIRYMFNNCYKLTTLDISMFNMSKVINMDGMFSYTPNLKTIYVSNFDTSNVTSSDDMFTGCNSIVGGNGTRYNSSRTDKTYARIDTTSTPGYFTYKAKSA